MLDEKIYKALLDYLNNINLCNNSDGMFPRSDRLTGNYYISIEYYYTRDGLLKGSVMTNFTELFVGGVITTPSEQDYLGLEVHFDIHSDNHVEITAIDSSSI